MNRQITPLVATVAALSMTLFAGCTALPETLDGATPSTPTGIVSTTSGLYGKAQLKSALSTLDTLPVKGKSAMTGYVRTTVFGAAWKDVDRNGCDTRNDILGRDLTSKTYKSGTHDCVVATGTLKSDPYTGTKIDFVRGPQSSIIQIDHVVALANAWVTGASTFSQTCVAKAGDDAYNAAIKAGKSKTTAKALSAAAKVKAKSSCDTKAQTAREALANDPQNLLAVQGRANMQKSDSDASGWLPSNKAYRCTYVAKQVEVKAKYSLWVTSAEKSAIAALLKGCTSGSNAAGFISGVPLDGGAGTTVSDASTAQKVESDAVSLPVAGFIGAMAVLAFVVGVAHNTNRWLGSGKN